MCRRVNMDARRRMPHTWLLPADSDRATPPVGKIVEPQDLVLVAPVTVPVAAAKLARIVRPDHILFCRGQLSASRAHASGRAGSSRAARSNSSTRVLIWPAWTCASPSATSAAYSLSWATAYVGQRFRNPSSSVIVCGQSRSHALSTSGARPAHAASASSCAAGAGNTGAGAATCTPATLSEPAPTLPSTRLSASAPATTHRQRIAHSRR
jgi:hypothetical protein